METNNSIHRKLHFFGERNPISIDVAKWHRRSQRVKSLNIFWEFHCNISWINNIKTHHDRLTLSVMIWHLHKASLSWREWSIRKIELSWRAYFAVKIQFYCSSFNELNDIKSSRQTFSSLNFAYWSGCSSKPLEMSLIEDFSPICQATKAAQILRIEKKNVKWKKNHHLHCISCLNSLENSIK